MKILTAFVLILLVAVPVQAHTDDRDRSRVDRRALPLLHIYNPDTHQNEDPLDYSYEELDYWLGVTHFRKWNDVVKVCQSMELMFGRMSSKCGTIELQTRSRAYVNYQRPIPQIIVASPRIITMTDPLTPPWSPSFQWYGPYGPYSPRGSYPYY